MYGDLPVVAGVQGEAPAEAEQEADAAMLDPEPERAQQPDETTAALPDASNVKVEAQVIENLTVESAFAHIAESLGLKDAPPNEVVAAFKQMASQAERPAEQPVQSVQDRTSRFQDQIQVRYQEYISKMALGSAALPWQSNKTLRSHP